MTPRVKNPKKRFKVGDVVKRTRFRNSFNNIEIGDIGVVTKISGSFIFAKVRFFNGIIFDNDYKNLELVSRSEENG